MKIAVVGTGYVGLVVGACLAETGNDVMCVDKDEAKVRLLRKGKVPIYEPGLSDIVKRNADEERLDLHDQPRRGPSNSRRSSSLPWARRRVKTARPIFSTCSAWPGTSAV